MGSSEGVKWDLSHWQGDSITENGKKCKKWELRVKQFQWDCYPLYRTLIILNSRSGFYSRMLSNLMSKS